MTSVLFEAVITRWEVVYVVPVVYVFWPVRNQLKMNRKLDGTLDTQNSHLNRLSNKSLSPIHDKMQASGSGFSIAVRSYGVLVRSISCIT